MRNFIPINAQPLVLSAYATSGLPVSYSVIQGADKVSITQNGDYYYVNPVALGYATLIATQGGSVVYAPADPVTKLVRVIGLPAELTVEAHVMVLPNAPTMSLVEQLEKPQAIVGSSNSVPLEPTSVQIEDLTPKKASKVRALCAPSDLQSVVAYDYANRPAGFGQSGNIIVSANVMSLPNAVSNVHGSSVKFPTMEYAINLTNKINVRSAKTDAVVNTIGVDPARFWDEGDTSNEVIVRTRNNYLRRERDSHGLLWNPMLSFESRPAEDINEFYYDNIYKIEKSGKYVKESTFDSPYHTNWKQWGNSDPWYIYLVAVKVHTYVVDVNALAEGGDGTLNTTGWDSGFQKFIEYKETLNVSGYQSQSAFETWRYDNIYLNHGTDVIWELNPNSYDALGIYILDKDETKPRGITLYDVYPYLEGDKTHFDTKYSDADKFREYSFSALLSASNDFILKYYTDLAGEIMFHYKNWDIFFEKFRHCPMKPTPFEETLTKMHPMYGINPYAIGGAGISIELADKTNIPFKSTSVTAELA
jgi:hypothetical protein